MKLLDRAISASLPFVPKPIVGFFSRPYIAGSESDDAIASVRALEASGAMATLDILGEFITEPAQAEANAASYGELLERIAAERLEDCYVSVKPTALGLLLDRELCLRLMRGLVEQAARLGNFVRLDMEDSACTDLEIGIYRELRESHPEHVGIVLQAMLRRTLDDVEALTDRPANFRLCKGIYLEPHTIAYTDYDIVRRNFAWALERMFERGAYVGIATHDEMLIWEALRLVDKHGVARERYEFQMLLGVREELRKILLDAGHRLRVYVPFGREWYAYSVRRLRENPTIAGHAFRALFNR